MAVTAFLVLVNLVLLGMHVRGRAAARRATREAAAAVAAIERSMPTRPVVRVLPPPHRPVAEVAVVPSEVTDLAAYRSRRAFRVLELAAR